MCRFWILLLLPAIIATAGILADSTATVIGAMIIAPLSVPIMGTGLAVVTSDGRRVWTSAALAVGGAAAVVLLGAPGVGLPEAGGAYRQRSGHQPDGAEHQPRCPGATTHAA